MDLLKLYHKSNYKQQYKVIEIDLKLSRDEILDALKYDTLIFDAQEFETPIDQLIEIFMNKKWGLKSTIILKQKIK